MRISSLFLLAGRSQAVLRKSPAKIQFASYLKRKANSGNFAIFVTKVKGVKAQNTLLSDGLDATHLDKVCPSARINSVSNGAETWLSG